MVSRTSVVVYVSVILIFVISVLKLSAVDCLILHVSSWYDHIWSRL